MFYFLDFFFGFVDLGLLAFIEVLAEVFILEVLEIEMGLECVFLFGFGLTFDVFSTGLVFRLGIELAKPVCFLRYELL